MTLAQRHDPVQTLAPCRQHEPFGERVWVRAPRRQPHHVHPTPLERRSELNRVQRVPVEQKVTPPHQEAVLGVEQIPRDLIHPHPVGVPGDSGDLDLPARDVDQEEYVVSDQSSPRDGLDGEKVRRGNRPEVRLDEGGPRHALPADWRRVDAVLEQDALVFVLTKSLR